MLITRPFKAGEWLLFSTIKIHRGMLGKPYINLGDGACVHVHAAVVLKEV